MASIELSTPQHIFLHELPTPYRAYVGGYGSGKTFVGCLDLLLFAAKHPGFTQGYFGPTYPAIRDIFYPTLEEAAELLGFEVDIKEANKEAFIRCGGRDYGMILCRSMDNPASIVGFKIARAMVDEIDTLSKKKAEQAWNKIIARMRLKVPGAINGIGVTTTPEGFKFVYERFARNPPAQYSMVQASTMENAQHLPDDYIDNLRSSYPAELVRAYLDGAFVNLTSGSVYRSYDRKRCASTEEIREGEPLWIGMDFNVLAMAACVNVRRGEVWHCVDEIKDGRDTPSMIETIRARYGGRSITVYPDASGKATSSKSASLSDIALLRQAGFAVRARSTNPRVKDRVNAVNKALEDGAWKVNAARCPRTAECLEQQAYDENGEPDKTTGHDHQNDAFGYPVAYERPVIRPMTKARLAGV